MLDANQIEIDSKMMAKAISLAKKAASKGEVPVGAVVVAPDGTSILASSYNLRETLQTPIAHAEILALHKAAKKANSWRLLDCTVYVTLEPCPMCAGALVNARIKRLVFGASDPKAGCVGSLMNLAQDPRLNHRFEITKGFKEVECAKLLSDFFKKLRKSKS